MRLSFATGILVLCATLAHAQAKVDPLAGARDLLEARTEKEVRDGAMQCAKADDVPAVELLLDALEQTERRSRLHLAPGHYRDIAWEGLLLITDQYARRRVAYEAEKGKDPRVRQWCCELLGIYGDRGFGDSLGRALGSKDDDLVRWAVRSLGMLKHDGFTAQITALCKHKSDYVRANAIEALARIDAAANLPRFLGAIRDDASGGVRCALLGAVPELAADRLEEICAAALRDRDWRPRLQAVENLGRTKTKNAVDALLLGLDDGRPVVAHRALAELQELTGQPITQPDVFRRWWADNRETFAFPEKRGVAARAQATTVVYNGLPVDSDHVAFLLDKSFAMQQKLASKGMPKEEAAVDELARVLQLLDGKITFNVWNYDVELTALEKKPVGLTDKNRKKALAFAAAPSKGREKDIWQALEAVVGDETLDTAYLLSSGEPDTGLYVHWNRVTRHLADLNRFHKVTVHTVAYTDSDWFRDQLKKIAEATGGHFEQVK